MPTINTILKEIKNVPVNKLDDLYSIIHSLQTDEKKSGGEATKQILSFAGSFSDMTEKDYREFLEHTQQTRNELFDREILV